MFSNRAAVVVLALACVVAAGVGGYVASRQNTVPAPAAAMAETTPAGNAKALVRAGQEAESPSTAAVATASTASRGVETTPATGQGTSSKPRRADAVRAAEAPIRPAPDARQDVPVQDRTSPATPAPIPPAAPAPVPAVADSPVTAARTEERPAQDPQVPPGPPPKTFEELVVSANSVIGLQTESRISSETARVEDRVEAKVTRDVRVADRVAIPAGSRALGSVTLVERGGKFKERARIGIRFTTLVMADGTRLPMSTETISREGEGPGNKTAAKIGGGAIAGTILGAILGGSKGAAIGAAAGAGGGAVAVEAGDRSEVTLPAGSPLTVRLLAPLAVTIEEK